MAALAKCRIAIKYRVSCDNLNRLWYKCITGRLNNKRSCSSGPTVPPLNVALPGVSSDNAKNGNLTSRNSLALEGVKVTTLSNGIKVASEKSFGPFCTLGGITVIS